MENSIIIYREQGAVFSAEFHEKELYNISVCEHQAKVFTGNIYIARVEKIIPGIKAAFVHVPGEEENWFLPLNKSTAPISSPKHSDGKLHEGDQILVQVECEAGKNKATTVVGDFSLTGCYFVVMHGKTGIHRSSKIENREFLDWVFPLIREEIGLEATYAVMVRTNAEGVSQECLLSELRFLLSEYHRIVSAAENRTPGTLLFCGLPGYLCALRDTYQQSYDKMLTDDPELYKEMKQFLSDFRPELLPALSLYDGSCPLPTIYNMKANLSGLLSSKVWLKSGAYLVIQQTEAMAVIDVNTGKSTASGKKTEGFLQCNLEAAKEVARQMRLRNLSGIIIVDFIDMKREEDNRKLLTVMEEYVKEDRIKTRVIDMTKLHLVEITRTKTRKPLSEQLWELGVTLS